MPSIEPLARFVLAFTLTQAVEIPIYTRLLRIRKTVAFGASAITHPIVWFVMPIVWRAVYLALIRRDGQFVMGQTGYFWGYGVLAEAFAVLVEACYFFIFGIAPRRAFGAALVANATSALLGLLIRSLTGFP